MSRIKFTPNQSAAIETLKRNVSVSAGAGSGKTAVLVERFCRIVENCQANVDEILTVTFTDKAAREMKDRIVRRFDEKFVSTGDRRYLEARRGVESAYIGTIHSFASRLLRENAFEAGVDPRFMMLTDARAEAIKDDVLEEMITTEYAKGTKEYLDLAQEFGKDEIRIVAKKLHSHLASLGKEVTDICAAKVELKSAMELATQYFDIVDELYAQLYARKLCRAIQNKLSDFEYVYESLKDKMAAIAGCPLLSNPSDYFQEFKWGDYQELSSAASFIPGNVGSKDIQKNYIKPAKEIAQQFLNVIIQPVAEHYINCMKRVTEDFRRNYDRAKRNIGALDFDDLLLAVRSLLIDDKGNYTPVANEYRERFKFVVMDEFQDTNSLQKRIIQAVAKPDRLFTVGDVKQSIFGFIHSDVDVFREHHDTVKNGGGVPLAFKENFRSRKGIISFVNWFFKNVWEEDQDFEFEELEPKGDFLGKTSPDVEVLFVPQHGDAGRSRLGEARAIAARISELLGRNGQKPFQVTKKKDGETPRDLQPGDIMILFRATASIPFYERALFEAGIENYVVSGRGFYSTHEVQDVLNILKVVENPLDDVAMAAVLRSPMVNISDDTLWWLTRDLSAAGDGLANGSIPPKNRDIGKLYSGILSFEKIPGLDELNSAKLDEFRKTLFELHSMRSEGRITCLIDRIFAKTKYDLKVLASANGKRKYANLRKLIGVAEGLESNRLFSLPEFIKNIESLMDIGKREGEAATETEDSQVVKLMTVHKAKGLQSPVVFVADCARHLKAGDASAFIVGKDAGIACKLKNPLTGDWIKTASYSALSDSLKSKDIREEKRLFYVAATRAEELLIISGSCDYKGKYAEKNTYSEINTWGGWVEKALGVCEDTKDTLVDLDSEDVTVKLSSGSSLLSDEQGRMHTAIEAYRESLTSGKRISQAEPENEHIKRCFAPGCSASPGLIMTVSRALTYVSCPKKYYLQWVLGVTEPGVAGDYDFDPEDEDSSYSAAELGTVVHQVLGSVDFTKDVGQEIERYLSYQPHIIRDSARLACKRLLDSVWLSRIKSADERMQEVPFTAVFDDISLYGRIDLLLKEKQGWVVIDYKTGSNVGDESYKQQVALYALAVERCIGVLPTEVVLLNLGDGKDEAVYVEPDMMGYASDMIRKTSEGIRGKVYHANPSDKCEYCGYKETICRI